MCHKLAWVAATSTRGERRGCGGLLRGVMIMKRIALAASALVALGVTFASPAKADIFNANIVLGDSVLSGYPPPSNFP